MNEDIRLSTTFFSHRKTKKLQRQLGDHGVMCLLTLWARVAIEKPSGDLSCWDKDDIEIEACFTGDPGSFVDTLVELGFLDNYNGYSLHNWETRQEWVVNAQDRSDRARLLRMAKTHNKIYTRLVNDGCTGVTRCDYNRLTKVQRSVNDTLTAPLTPAPVPVPDPDPVPDPVPVPKKETTIVGQKPRQQIPFKEIIDFFNETTGKDFKHTTNGTKSHIRARWAEGFRLDDFKEVIKEKHFEWSTNPEMEQYVRPQTLFGTKFESYLQAAKDSNDNKPKSKWVPNAKFSANVPH
jgi:uncharacterized phage protein (TIGR02220 family)